jgi:proteasome lid subunit RPN8/RPN11
MKIRENILEQIVNHAKKSASIEACGYLASKDNVLSLAYELTNIDHSFEHFSFDPKEQFSAFKDARNRGFEITAVYHSHPASPARPSQEDIRLGLDAEKLYVIISLLGGGEDIRAFWIRNGQVTEEIMEVVDDDRL